MNFQRGTTLDTFHDSIFSKIASRQSISEKDIGKLKNNCWMRVAFWVAPSSAVIYHYCLLDICNREARYVNRIFIMLLLMSQGAYGKIWVEGYSCWQHIRSLLVRYSFLLHGLRHHGDISINRLIREIDVGFLSTSYFHQDNLYPPPIGDLSYGALHEVHGFPKPGHNPKNFYEDHDCPIYVGPVLKKGDTYTIQESCIGFNHRTKNSKRLITFRGGVLRDIMDNKPYTFYEGGKNKYPTIKSLLKDLFTVDRIISAVKISFQSFFVLLSYKTGFLKRMYNRGK